MKGYCQRHVQFNCYGIRPTTYLFFYNMVNISVIIIIIVQLGDGIGDREYVFLGRRT